jgi:hypothetical protein
LIQKASRLFSPLRGTQRCCASKACCCKLSDSKSP